MIAFIDPKTQQVMAYYSHGTTSTAWTDKGYEQVEVAKNIVPLLHQLGRDCKAEVKEGLVIAVEASENPDKPQPSEKNLRLAELKAKLADDTITDTELKELLKLVIL